MKLFVLITYLFSYAVAADRLYTADEISNTVSVLDPQTEQLLGIIMLGHFRPNSLASFVSKETQINVHGITVSPDKKMIAAISNVTNSVVFIESQSAQPKAIVYVGRSPHGGTYRPDGKELWVNNRGQDYISIIDTKKMKEISKLKTEKAPSFTLFLKSKSYAFVCNAWTKKIQIFNYKTKKLIKVLEIENTFSPVMALSPDEKEIWLVQKDIHSVARISTEKLSVIESFKTGLYTQHTQFLKKNNQIYGLVTVGGENLLKVYKFDEKKSYLFKEIPITGVPHGVWSAPSGNKIFVATEHGDKVVVVDTNTFSVKKEIPVGKSPQGLIYVSDAVNEKKIHEIGLSPLYLKEESKTITVRSLSHDSVGSVVLRSHEYTDYLTIQTFDTLKTTNLKVFATESTADYLKIHKKDLVLIGYLHCLKSFTCISESSIPLNSVIRSVFNNEGQIFFIDEISNSIFMKSEVIK